MTAPSLPPPRSDRRPAAVARGAPAQLPPLAHARRRPAAPGHLLQAVLLQPRLVRAHGARGGRRRRARRRQRPLPVCDGCVGWLGPPPPGARHGAEGPGKGAAGGRTAGLGADASALTLRPLGADCELGRALQSASQLRAPASRPCPPDRPPTTHRSLQPDAAAVQQRGGAAAVPPAPGRAVAGGGGARALRRAPLLRQPHDGRRGRAAGRGLATRLAGHVCHAAGATGPLDRATRWAAGGRGSQEGEGTAAHVGERGRLAHGVGCLPPPGLRPSRLPRCMPPSVLPQTRVRSAGRLWA